MRFLCSKYDLIFANGFFRHQRRRSQQSNFGILEDLGKEVYIAEINDLGASACRILVPDIF